MEISLLLIRITVSLVMICFGLNQLLDPKHWVKDFMPKFLIKLLPINSTNFMRIHALGNSSLGFLFLSGLFIKPAAYLTFLWWFTILPFAFYYDWKTGLRDLTITAT